MPGYWIAGLMNDMLPRFVCLITWGCMSVKMKDEQVQEEGLVRRSTYNQHHSEAQQETKVHTHEDNPGGKMRYIIVTVSSI